MEFELSLVCGGAVGMCCGCAVAIGIGSVATCIDGTDYVVGVNDGVKLKATAFTLNPL